LRGVGNPRSHDRLPFAIVRSDLIPLLVRGELRNPREREKRNANQTIRAKNLADEGSSPGSFKVGTLLQKEWWASWP
jgi:hypothetical protein